MRSRATHLRHPARTAGFTLVELLVVIGIIGLLVSILLPALNTARQQAALVQCASNQRQLMLGFLMFANEHKGHLPGNFVDYDRADADERSWLANYGQTLAEAPASGTVFRYVGQNRGLYRCPSQLDNGYGGFTGTNGVFDYCTFGVFTGALLPKIPNETKLTRANGIVENYPTPVICEETPDGMNGPWLPDALFNNVDQHAQHHRGGSNIACIDGSVHYLRPAKGIYAYSWVAKAPSGRMVGLNNWGFGIKWGWWNKQ